MMHILAFLLVYLTSYFYPLQVFGLPTNAGIFDKRLDETTPLQMYEVLRDRSSRQWETRYFMSIDENFDTDPGHCEAYPWNVKGTVGGFDNVYMSTVFSLQSSFGFIMCYLPKKILGEMVSKKDEVIDEKFDTLFTKHFLIEDGELSRAIQKLQELVWEKDCVVPFRIFGAQTWTLQNRRTVKGQYMTSIFAQPAVEQIERSFERYLTNQNQPLNEQTTTFEVDPWYFKRNDNKATLDKSLKWSFALWQSPMDVQGKSTAWIWLGGAAEGESSKGRKLDLPPVSKLELSSGRNLPPLVFMEGKLSS